MMRLPIPSILVLLLLLLAPSAISAQPAQPPRVCVMGSDTSFWPAVRTNSTPSACQERDLVVKYLKKLSSNGPERLEAVTLTSTNSDEIRNEINKIDCNFTVILTVNHLSVGKRDYRDQPDMKPSTPLTEPPPIQTPPISFYIMRRVSEHLSVSLPNVGYNPPAWSEGIAAEEVYKAILKNPVP